MTAPVRVTFLGGLGEIGRNCAVLEIEGQLLVLDCGQMFGDETTPGVDTVLPDFGFLRERAGDIVGCIATHAHEDHIGGLPYLLDELPMPVWGSPFTIGMVRNKLEEKGIAGSVPLHVIHDGETHRIGPVECEFIPVTHSTPSGLITAFHTPQGIILHSSDFKLDFTPVDGRVTDLARIGALSADPGIRLLLADSTNADSPGFSSSETEVGGVLAQVFAERPDRRLIVGAFSSHIHRLQQVSDAAMATGRVLVVVGRSMQRNVGLARDLGLLKVPDHAVRSAEEADDLPPDRVCIVCTGSQGEPRSALTLMAKGESKFVTVGPDDTVVLSSHPIPGNEAAVARIRNDLARRGVEVVHSGHLDVHTTGHGKAHELRTLHSVARPEYFVPVHGEYFHLQAHAGLAAGLGMDDDHVLVCVDGDQVVLDETGLRRGPSTSGAEIYVDGMVGSLGSTVLSQRHILGAGGFVAALVTVSLTGRRRLGEVEVVSRGWIEPPDHLGHEAAVADEVRRSVDGVLDDPEVTAEDVERVVRRAAGRTINDRTGRRPMVVPVVLDADAV